MLITHCELKEESVGDCAEANAALRRANMGLKALDEYLKSYLADYTKLTKAQKVLE